MFELMKKTPAAILKFFLENPSGEFYLKEVHEKTKVAKSGLINWLNKFVKMGILTKKTRGRLSIYSLKSGDSLVRQLRILVSVSTLLPLAGEIGKMGAEVYIYGSVARGEDVEGSDVDLLVIGKIEPQEVARLAQAFSRKVGRSVRPQIFSKFEWSQTDEKDPAFFKMVERDKVRLV